MAFTRKALIGTVVLWPVLAMGQTAYPPGVTARAIALQQRCAAGGGQVVNGDRPFVHNMDLTGDGKPEFILDEAGFACSNRAVTSVTPNGAPLEVFDGASGQSLWRGLAFTYALEAGPARNSLAVTQRGTVCGANATVTSTCRRPLAWNPQARTLTGVPPLSVQAAQAPTVQPKAPPPALKQVGSLTLTEAEKTAAFRALSFAQVGGEWRRCNEQPRMASSTPGRIEEVLDLNADGRPEVVIAESSSFCYGSQGNWFAVLTKEANGTWRQVLEMDGMFMALDTRANGWREIEIGGPGTRGFPVWRYNGKEYVYNRGPRP